MPIRFAAATSGANASRWRPASKPETRTLVARAMERMGNDNGPIASGQGLNNQGLNNQGLNNEILRAALRHFAQHGLGAGPVARARAQAASLAQDREGFEWWLAITRTLDRRLAADIERRTPHPA